MLSYHISDIGQAVRCLALALIGALGLAVPVVSQDWFKAAVVTTSELPLLSGHARGSRAVGSLSEGTFVIVYSQRDGRFLVGTKNGKDVWVDSAGATVLPEPAEIPGSRDEWVVEVVVPVPKHDMDPPGAVHPRAVIAEGIVPPGALLNATSVEDGTWRFGSGVFAKRGTKTPDSGFRLPSNAVIWLFPVGAKSSAGPSIAQPIRRLARNSTVFVQDEPTEYSYELLVTSADGSTYLDWNGELVEAELGATEPVRSKVRFWQPEGILGYVMLWHPMILFLLESRIFLWILTFLVIFAAYYSSRKNPRVGIAASVVIASIVSVIGLLILGTVLYIFYLGADHVEERSKIVDQTQATVSSYLAVKSTEFHTGLSSEGPATTGFLPLSPELMNLPSYGRRDLAMVWYLGVVGALLAVPHVAALLALMLLVLGLHYRLRRKQPSQTRGIGMKEEDRAEVIEVSDSSVVRSGGQSLQVPHPYLVVSEAVRASFHRAFFVISRRAISESAEADTRMHRALVENYKAKRDADDVRDDYDQERSLARRRREHEDEKLGLEHDVERLRLEAEKLELERRLEVLEKAAKSKSSTGQRTARKKSYLDLLRAHEKEVAEVMEGLKEMFLGWSDEDSEEGKKYKHHLELALKSLESKFYRDLEDLND